LEQATRAARYAQILRLIQEELNMIDMPEDKTGEFIVKDQLRNAMAEVQAADATMKQRERRFRK
jgi:hypothetical protein